MRHLSLTFFCLSILFRLALGLSPTYLECQLEKAAGESPLKGCPEGTIYVSPTDTNANHSTIQSAIDSLPTDGNAVILVGKGDYHESIITERRAALTLLGQLDTADPSLNASQRNIVHVWNTLCVGSGAETDEDTAVLTVRAPQGYNSGNPDFRAYNIGFKKLSTYPSQGLVLALTLANGSFYGCTFEGWQDTVFVGFGASAFFTDSIISGETDFIFGFGVCYIEKSILALRGCGGGIAAWQGTAGSKAGVYINKSKVMRSWDIGSEVVTTHQCCLGRPWNSYARTVYMNTFMDDSINSTGFCGWHPGDSVPATTFYAEYNSTGTGGDLSGRVRQDHILNSRQAKMFQTRYLFPAGRGWIDFKYQSPSP